MSLVYLIQRVDEDKHQHQICFLCQHSSFLDKQGPAGLQGSRRATRWRNTATFRLNALIACRLLSATEHHSLQQAGPVERKKRQEDGGDEEALCPRPAATDTITLREQHKTYCYSDRKSRFFETMYPCVPAWGVHTVLWEGFELTQVTVAPSPVWRRRGDELFNQPTLLGSDVLLCLMGRWGEPATTSSTSSQGGRHMTAPG